MQTIFNFYFRIIYCVPDSLIHESSFVEKLINVVPQLEICHGIPSISKLHLDLNKLPSLLIMDDLVSKS